MSPANARAKKRTTGQEHEEHSFVDASGQPFTVTLTNFEGPFDLLLQLIARRQLDVTEVALSQVTDEFIEQVRLGADTWDLEQTSLFLVVAATLLDLKAARLLPSGEVEDVEDLDLLEARDLLFARLLQYRAYKEVSRWFAAAMEQESKVYVRPGGLEPQFRGLLPEVTIPGGAARLAKIAEKVFSRTEEPEMPLEQLHLVQVSVRDQANVIADRLRTDRVLTFRELTADVDRLHTVARFLALLELFRQAQVAFEQPVPLGELLIRWTGSDDGELVISDEFDQRASDDEDEPDEADSEALDAFEAGEERDDD